MLISRRRSRSTRVCLGIEVCEPRRYLTYAPTFVGGILFLNGRDDALDKRDVLVSITVAGGDVKYTDEGGLHGTGVAPADVDGIIVLGHDGNDSIDLSGLGAVLANLEQVS